MSLFKPKPLLPPTAEQVRSIPASPIPKPPSGGSGGSSTAASDRQAGAIFDSLGILAEAIAFDLEKAGIPANHTRAVGKVYREHGNGNTNR